MKYFVTFFFISKKQGMSLLIFKKGCWFVPFFLLPYPSFCVLLLQSSFWDDPHGHLYKVQLTAHRKLLILYKFMCRCISVCVSVCVCACVFACVGACVYIYVEDWRCYEVKSSSTILYTESGSLTGTRSSQVLVVLLVSHYVIYAGTWDLKSDPHALVWQALFTHWDVSPDEKPFIVWNELFVHCTCVI